MLQIDKTDLTRHHAAQGFSDRFAYTLVRGLGIFARSVFGQRYGHRTIVLETIAAVPGMVAATLMHLKCLRRLQDDRGWVRSLMDEAENQRTHLMVFVALDRPNGFERILILLAQGLFYNAHFLICLCSPRTAHRITGYFAEDAVTGYGEYLREIDQGRRENPPAPEIAIAYWNLDRDAHLREAIAAMQEDEAIHRDINHGFADVLTQGQDLPDPPSPLL